MARTSVYTRAARVLDTLYPEWYNAIDTKRLDMSNPQYHSRGRGCIAAQLEYHYHSTDRRYASSYTNFLARHSELGALGNAFGAMGQDQWLAEIRKRQDAELKAIEAETAREPEKVLASAVF